jgi:hypothetical protein
MTEQNIFAEEWRRCLREHYKYIIKESDKVTEQTLVTVLHRVGFTENELRQLYMEATIRAEDMSGDVLPDVQKLPYQMHPAECTCAACMEQVLDIGHDAEGQPLSAEEIAHQETESSSPIFAIAKPETSDDSDADAPETPDDSPRQMSMF